MKQAVLLHTIADAKHYLANDIELFKDARLFSANIHVVSFLKFRHECECADLCSYVTAQEFQQIQSEMIRRNSTLLNELDERLAPEINRYLDLPIRYFEPLYSFTGARQLVLFALLELMLRRMLEQERFDRVVTYEGKLGSLQSSFNEFLTAVFPDVRVVTIRYAPPEQIEKTTIRGVTWQQIPDLLVTARETTNNPIQYILQTGTNDQHILVFEPFSQSDALDQQAKVATMHTFQPQPHEVKRVFDYRLNPKVLPAWEELDIHSTDVAGKKQLKLLYQAIGQHFCYHFIQYLQVFFLYRRLHDTMPLEKVYWEYPPYTGAGALLLEYFLHDKQVQVTGIQSKATALLGKVAAPFAPVTVFSRCHQFITYDKTQESSLKKLLDNRYTLSTVIVKERPNLKRSKTKRENVDIAIYLSPSMNFLETGQIPSHVHSQLELLKFFEALPDKKIHVITHPYVTLKNCAVLSVLEELQHVKWIKGFSHEDYLTKHSPKLLLLDRVNYMVEEFLEETFDTVVFQKGAKVHVEQQKSLAIYVNTIDELRQYIKTRGKSN